MDYSWEEEEDEEQSDPNDETYVPVTDDESTEEEFLDNGEFYIDDWKGYPSRREIPPGPFRILQGREYEDARAEANAENDRLHKKHPEWAGMQIHERHPVKFGGDPIGINNKMILTPQEHARYTAFWNRILSEMGK